MRITSLFTWQKGRQQSGYDKMLLATARWPVKFDCYLLRFPEGSEISAHTDPAKTGQHHRLNIILQQAREGGIFLCEELLFESKRIKYFRPDLHQHAVSRINKGTRYVLSIGWLQKG